MSECQDARHGAIRYPAWAPAQQDVKEQEGKATAATVRTNGPDPEPLNPQMLLLRAWTTKVDEYSHMLLALGSFAGSEVQTPNA
jgi:hypothetical protein